MPHPHWLPYSPAWVVLLVSLTATPSLAQGVDRLNDQLAIPPIQEPITPAQQEAHHLFQLGQAAQKEGDLAKAIQLWRGALERYQALRDTEAMGVVQEYLGITYLQLGYFPEADQAFRQSLAAARDLGHEQRQIYALNNIGTMLLNRSDPHNAEATFRQAVEVARRIGSEAGEGLSLSNLGLALASQGDYSGAIPIYEAAWVLRRRHQQIGGHAYTLNNMGDAYKALDRHPQALAEYRLARWYAEREGDVRNQFRALEGLAYSYGVMRRWTNAFQALDDWINLARVTENTRLELRGLHLYAQYHFLLGRGAEARGLYENAIAVAQTLEDPDLVTILRNELGQVLYRFPPPRR